MDVDLIAKTETGSLDLDKASEKKSRTSVDSKIALKNLFAALHDLV